MAGRTPSKAKRVKSLECGYVGFFGLHEAPFVNTPDSRFFFAHDSCQVALNTLMVATRSGEGFIKITGDVGTGKTLLCRKFLEELKDPFISAYIPNPYLEPMSLLMAIADELSIPYPKRVTQHQLLKLFTSFLIDGYASHGRVVVLCLDEAHAMPSETLEALRLLSNLETPRRKLMQVVLFGQPELDGCLEQPSLRQLKQRISFSAHLEPLTKSNLEDYVQHRLLNAGYQGPRLFAERAIGRIYKASKGVPRLINILAHKALLAAYGEGSRSVQDHHVRLAVADTDSLRARIAHDRRWWAYVGTALSAATASIAAQVLGS